MIKKCRSCDLLYELFTQAPYNDRNYWVFTELFVLLHDGKDYCYDSLRRTMK